ncbi:ABC transporter permease [Gordonia caeni]|uniref:ABC transporter permease subunit n=1 Tax=Gordonia caeni TaxID=1007097 RepID=A0ABP7P250_9ACTN
MNLTAVRVITVLELRQRIRSTRWKWSALALFALISAIVFASLYLATLDSGTYTEWSRELLTIALGTVLFVGMIGAPAISAATINGDRREATLAVVQATPITAWELTLGKFLGAWLASLIFIVLASPYLIWGVVSAPSSIGFSILAIVVTALLLGSYCAIGLGFSALSTRPTASTMLTLATVLLLLVGLPAVFGLALPSTQREYTVVAADYRWERSPADSDTAPRSTCVDRPQQRTFTHSERIWWLLTPNPVLIVADTLAAGTPETHRYWGFGGSPSVPQDGARVLSGARSGEMIAAARCGDGDFWQMRERYESRFVGRNWYIGLLFTVAVGAAGLLVAARRLRIPAGKLPKGVRVA